MENKKKRYWRGVFLITLWYLLPILFFAGCFALSFYFESSVFIYFGGFFCGLAIILYYAVNDTRLKREKYDKSIKLLKKISKLPNASVDIDDIIVDIGISETKKIPCEPSEVGIANSTVITIRANPRQIMDEFSELVAKYAEDLENTLNEYVGFYNKEECPNTFYLETCPQCTVLQKKQKLQKRENLGMYQQLLSEQKGIKRRKSKLIGELSTLQKKQKQVLQEEQPQKLNACQNENDEQQWSESRIKSELEKLQKTSASNRKILRQIRDEKYEHYEPIMLKYESIDEPNKIVQPERCLPKKCTVEKLNDKYFLFGFVYDKYTVHTYFKTLGKKNRCAIYAEHSKRYCQ